jgi:hypothetical protein
VPVCENPMGLPFRRSERNIKPNSKYFSKGNQEQYQLLCMILILVDFSLFKLGKSIDIPVGYAIIELN